MNPKVAPSQSLGWWLTSGFHQLRLVVYQFIPFFFSGFYISQVVGNGISEPSTVVQFQWFRNKGIRCVYSVKEGLYLIVGEAADFQFSQRLLLAQDTLSGLWQDVLIVCLAKHLQGHTGMAECGEINKLSKCFLKKGLQMETITISGDIFLTVSDFEGIRFFWCGKPEPKTRGSWLNLPIGETCEKGDSTWGTLA